MVPDYKDENAQYQEAVALLVDAGIPRQHWPIEIGAFNGRETISFSTSVSAETIYDFAKLVDCSVQRQGELLTVVNDCFPNVLVEATFQNDEKNLKNITIRGENPPSSDVPAYVDPW